MEKTKTLVIFEGNPKPYLSKALEEAGIDVVCLLQKKEIANWKYSDYWLDFRSRTKIAGTNIVTYVKELYQQVLDMATVRLLQRGKVFYVGRILPLPDDIQQIEHGAFAGFELKKKLGLPFKGLAFVTIPRIKDNINEWIGPSNCLLDCEGKPLDIKVIETTQVKDAVLSEMADKLRLEGREVIFVTKDVPLRGKSFKHLAKCKGILEDFLDYSSCENYFDEPSFDVYSFLNLYDDFNYCGFVCSRAPYSERECSLAELKMYRACSEYLA